MEFRKIFGHARNSEPCSRGYYQERKQGELYQQPMIDQTAHRYLA